MMNTEKHMLIAIAVSAAIMLLNIYAVSNGMADGYYSQVTELLHPLMVK